MERRTARTRGRGQRLLQRAAAATRCVCEPLDRRVLLSGDIFVTVLHDANGNGVKDLEEPALAGWSVFLDLDHDRAHDAGEPLQLTDVDGETRFTGLAPGDYDVVEIPQTGWGPTVGYSVAETVTIIDNETIDVLFLNVPTANGGIAGVVWDDRNGDGVRAADDPGLAGWTVFIDENENRDLDAGEPSTLTDAGGAYAFADVAPGTWRVREVLPNGWEMTLGYDNGAPVDVTPGAVAVLDFGNFNGLAVGAITGTVWNDVNADGLRAAGDPGLGGWTVFLDSNSNAALDTGEPSAVTDALGAYSFPSVREGSYRVTQLLEAGWSASPGHPVAVNVTVVGENTTVVDFANYTPTLGSISGTVWNDLNSDGVINLAESGLGGWTVFIDRNADGIANAGEPSAVTAANGSYTLSAVAIGSAVVREVPAVGWSPTAPGTGMQLVNVPNAANVTGINFGNKQRTEAAISGVVFVDQNHNGVRDAGENALPGIRVYFDTNADGAWNAGEPSVLSAADAFYTPGIDESGTYQFTHLATGIYLVGVVVPDVLSATPAAARQQVVALATGEDRRGVNFGGVYRPNEIRGAIFDDVNRNHTRDPGEAGIPGVTVYIDLDRDDAADPAEPRTVSGGDGSYSFTTSLVPGAYVIRALHHAGRADTYPETHGGILWPPGVSNPTIGNVTPTGITTSLAEDQTEQRTVSLTLPNTGALTNKADVFLLFDDTGSFTMNSPIVRAAFPQIISTLQAALPGVDWGFGVGRFEEYANFAAEYGVGRPFILNQPIISASTPGFASSIQAALDRTAPGYGGDQPETDIEALYQMATGVGFDGNHNGTITDSGPAGMVSTQVNPGTSGDVPSFASFTVDPAGNVLPAAGHIGGAGFRPGALPIILTATDTGFAFQPMGETSITGVGGLTLPISSFMQTSRQSTPFASGAGIQQTVTALNALGALVVGLGTNGVATQDPRQGLEALARLTGAVNRSTTTIANGTLDPIAPGDPLYFEISSGFGASVANGIVVAIENAVSHVAVNVTLKPSDPRVHIDFTPAVVNSLGAGQTATFDVTFTGDGRPHRFDLLFVREGTDVVLGSIPVVIGTPIPGDGFCYDELEDGEIAESDDFGASIDSTLPLNVAPSFVAGPNQNVLTSLVAGPVHAVANWASGISAGAAWETSQVLDFIVTNDNNALFLVQPAVAPDGTLTCTPAPGAFGSATVTVRLHDSGGTVGGGQDTSAAQTFAINVTLDIGRGHLVVPGGDIGSRSGGAYTGLTGLIASGRNGGTWDGVGIITSQADAKTGLTSPGIARAADLLGLSAGQTGLWEGHSVDANSVVMKYTYAGDANLDGFISGDDYSAIDFASATPGAFGWSNGDFNYDGIISGDDYSIIDFNLVAQGTPLTGAGPAGTAGGGVYAPVRPAGTMPWPATSAWAALASDGVPTLDDPFTG